MMGSSIVVSGGTGILGRELYKIDNSLVCIDSSFDIFDFRKLKDFLDEFRPEIIIHCASIKTEGVDKSPIHAINVNIIGSANLSKYCIENKIRLVYISTDYVYPGKDGNYKESDYLYPHNKYSWTKLAGEASTLLVDNHLIIRTSFGESIFPYEQAYDNLFTSKDYVDIIAPMILKASLSKETGVINIGTDRKSLFEYANYRNDIDSSSLNNQKDFSLNTDKFKNL